MSQRLEHGLAMRLLRFVARPVVRFSLRHGLKLQDVIEVLKAVFVDIAVEHAHQPDRNLNVSRVSLMTGVHRRDIQRLRSREQPGEYEKDLVTKVIGRWLTDRQFTTKDRSPRTLTYEGAESEFFDLVRTVSSDVGPLAVLFELDRIQAVERTRSGLKLVHESYVPQGDPGEGFELLARDSCDLLHAVEENVLMQKDPSNFHARTEFDNVRPAAIKDLKNWFLKEGHKFHARIRDIVSRHDQDVNPDRKFKGKGMRVVFGGYSFVSGKEEK